MYDVKHFDNLVEKTRWTHIAAIGATVVYGVSIVGTVAAALINMKNIENKYTKTSVGCLSALLVGFEAEKLVECINLAKDTKMNYQQSKDLAKMRKDLDAIENKEEL